MPIQLILYPHACFVIRNKYLPCHLYKNSQQAFLTFALKHINTKNSTKDLGHSVFAKTQKRNELINIVDKVVIEILVDINLIINKTLGSQKNTPVKVEGGLNVYTTE